jgi:hypothetical protein
MKMDLTTRFAGCLAVSATLLAPVPAQAQALKCVDPSGKVTYADAKLPGHNCTAVQGNVNVVPPPSATVPQRMPSASSRQPGGADRRKELESRLAAEEQALEAARKDLAEQEAVRYGDERNYQRVLDRLQPYKERVEQQEQQVEAVRRELSNLR